jgi:hypothetical protein
MLDLQPRCASLLGLGGNVPKVGVPRPIQLSDLSQPFWDLFCLQKLVLDRLITYKRARSFDIESLPNSKHAHLFQRLRFESGLKSQAHPLFSFELDKLGLIYLCPTFPSD